MPQLGNDWVLSHAIGLIPEIHPADDMRPHVMEAGSGKRCWCGTHINDCGNLIHRAADEREKFETRARLPS